jgi:hypothetical protein
MLMVRMSRSRVMVMSRRIVTRKEYQDWRVPGEIVKKKRKKSLTQLAKSNQKMTTWMKRTVVAASIMLEIERKEWLEGNK